ncbi:ATP-binding protein [Lysinibacillus sphaericus]|nr:ATP-binding protein [Lysinibacillus sphaericus]
MSQQQILDFQSLRFVEENENIVFLGPSGVGKTSWPQQSALRQLKSEQVPILLSAMNLIQNLKKARLESRLKHYTRYKLLIIDEIGYLPIDPEDAKLFFQLIDARYEKRSTIFTTNVNFKSWDEIFPEPKLANAILDRILHHASVVTIIGDSYRLKHHLTSENE